MADFCRQCSIENFGEDYKDFQFTAPDGMVTAVLCEGCGPAYVDNDGNCVCDWCLKQHGKAKTMDIDDWISVTRLGSDYEHQMSPSTNKQRHRQLSFTGVEYPWTMGAPPDMIQQRPPERPSKKPIATFEYKNHRGVTANRTVTVDSVEYIKEPGFDYPPGWFVSGYCHDKKARRSFALSNITVPDHFKFMKLFST